VIFQDSLISQANKAKKKSKLQIKNIQTLNFQKKKRAIDKRIKEKV
jgi:hypothetical protein